MSVDKKAYMKEWRNRNKELIDAYNAKYYIDNKESLTKKDREYKKNNRTLLMEKSRKYQKENKEDIKSRRDAKRIVINLRNSEWKRNNRDINAAQEAKRRSAKLNRTPKWLTAIDNEDMKLKYFMADFLNTITLGLIGYEVDHYYPLQGATVSGLHVPSNLNVMRASDNRSKSNRHPEV